MNQNEKKLLESVSEGLIIFAERQNAIEKKIDSTRNSVFWSSFLIIALLVILNLFQQRVQLNAKIYQQNESNLSSKKELRDKIATTLSSSQFLLKAQFQQCKLTHDNKTIIEQKIARNNMLPSLFSMSFGASYEFSQTVEQALVSYANKFEGIDDICKTDLKQVDDELKKQIRGIIFDMNQRIKNDSKNLLSVGVSV